jgi:hypothetical protein
MRGWTTTIVIVVIAAILLALFQFLFRNQMNKKVDELEARNAELRQELDRIAQMEASIEPLAREIPRWKQKIELYKAAIPSQIDDHVFFNSLRTEMGKAGVSLLNIEVAPGGPWLGSIKEEEEKKLEGIGVDVAAAKSLRVAFYSVDLVGPYDKVLDTLENLKKHRRMYSIDEVMGPSGSGGGTVSQVVSAANTPIKVSGKIFFGIKPDYVSQDELDLVFQRVILRPLAGRVGKSVNTISHEVANKGEARER